MNDTTQGLLSDDEVLRRLFASEKDTAAPVAPLSALQPATARVPVSPGITAPPVRPADPVLLGLAGGGEVFAVQPAPDQPPGGGPPTDAGPTGPFSLLSPNNPAAGAFQINPGSRLYAAVGSNTLFGLSGLGVDIPIQAGTQVWIEITGQDDGGFYASSAAVKYSASAPYSGGDLVAYTQQPYNGGTQDIWTTSYRPVAEVYSYDPASGLQHGGQVLGFNGSSFEVVRLLFSHQALTRISTGSVAALFPLSI